MSTDIPHAPLSARLKLLAEPDLGAGNFLQYALRHNPNRSQPLLYGHHTDERDEVVLRGYSLSDLEAARDAYAKWYWVNGIRPGDVVGVLVAEGTEPLLQYLALTALGAIPAMVNDAMAPHDVKRYLDHVGVVGVVADQPDAITIAFEGTTQPTPLFIANTSELHAYDPTGGELPEWYPHQHAPDEVVALIHSSGTTGTPKSTVLAHRQFWVGKRIRLLRFPVEPYDRLLCLMPHTHAGGLSYFLTASLLGLPIVAMSDWHREVVEPVMTAFQPTMVASFPRSFVALATGPAPVEAAAKVHTWFNTGDGAHYGHIRKLVQLGQRPAGLIQPWLLSADKESQPALAGSRFIDGLGSSEMGMALFGQVTTPESVRDDRCVGKPVSVVRKAAVLDAEGNEMPDGVAGMLGVKTPTRTPGYWNAPELTRSFELAGYWLTGDVVRRTSDGRFYHLDRTADVIKTARGAVYSLPIEEVLLADHDGVVLDCAVIAVPAADGEDHLPVAVVRLQPDVTEPSIEDLYGQFNQTLTSVGLTELAAVLLARTDAQFPTGVTGKVLKRELRERLATLFTDPVRHREPAAAAGVS